MAERILTPSDERTWFSSAPAILLLWAGILAGPMAWALDLSISYAIVKWTCSSQHTVVLHAITIVAMLLTAAGAWASTIALRRGPADAVDDAARPADRAKFMALLGLTSCALFALAIIASVVPRVALDACLG
jgi:hypothetical protein